MRARVAAKADLSSVGIQNSAGGGTAYSGSYHRMQI